MLYFEIIFGVVLAVVAFICLVAATEEPATLLLFVPCGIAAGFLISAGFHRDWAEGHAEHVAIYRAAVEQGYPVRSSDVHSGYGATLDVRVGRCVLTLEGQKVAGRWRFGVKESGTDASGGIVYLLPSAVAKFAEVCPK